VFWKIRLEGSKQNDVQHTLQIMNTLLDQPTHMTHTNYIPLDPIQNKENVPSKQSRKARPTKTTRIPCLAKRGK
jgi:hypothetical protein